MPARVIFQRFLASLGLLNNAILIILIWKKSPKKLGNYKILMIYIAVFEILYSLLDLLTTPECFSKDSVFLIIINLNSTFVPEFVATCATGRFIYNNVFRTFLFSADGCTNMNLFKKLINVLQTLEDNN